MTARRTAPILPLLAALLCALQVYAFHWGVITPDTVEQYRQVLSGDYADWHPPVTAWLWRQLGRIHGGPAPFLLMDCALYWGGFLLIAQALRRDGRTAAAWVAIAIAVLPIPFGQIGAILKDSLLAASMVAATGLLAWSECRSVIHPDRHPGEGRGDGDAGGGSRSNLARLAAALLLILAAATRFNALFAAAPLLLFCTAPAVWHGRWWQLIAGLIAATLLLAGTSTLINRVLLQPRQTHPLLSLINFDLAGISVASGRSAYPAAIRPDAALIAGCYQPALYNRQNDPACGAVEDDLQAWLEAGHGSALRLWLAAIGAEPRAWAEHRLRHFNVNQRFLVARPPDDAVYVMQTPANDEGLAFTLNPLGKFVYRAATVMAATPLGRPATWLALALAALLLSTRPLARALALSALLYGSGYALVSVAPDLRYNLWTLLAAALAALLAASDLAGTSKPARWRLAAALAPLLLVMVGELVWWRP